MNFKIIFFLVWFSSDVMGITCPQLAARLHFSALGRMIFHFFFFPCANMCPLSLLLPSFFHLFLLSYFCSENTFPLTSHFSLPTKSLVTSRFVPPSFSLSCDTGSLFSSLASSPASTWVRGIYIYTYSLLFFIFLFFGVHI